MSRGSIENTEDNSQVDPDLSFASLRDRRISRWSMIGQTVATTEITQAVHVSLLGPFFYSSAKMFVEFCH